MGNGERQGRRALVDHARNAVTLANECNAAVAEAQAKHNVLAQTVKSDMASLTATLADLKSRADAQRAWLKKVEDKSDREQSRLTMTRIELGQSSLEHGNFALMSLWQRLRWLLTGHWPRPLPVFAADDGTHVEECDNIDRGKLTSLVMSEPRQPLTGYIPHTSRGPAVLP